MPQTHPVQKIKNYFHLLQALYANIKYGFPSNKLKIFGVTGTDGKTTSTFMLYHVLRENGLKVGYISTIGAKIEDVELDTGLHVTTPDPWMVPKYLKEMSDKGVEYVILETTSNGFEQNRLWGIKFEGGIITNIKSDHLDYHGTWENYAKAKFRLAKQLKPEGVLVINQDDKKGYNWLKQKIADSNQKINLKEISSAQAGDVNFSLSGFEFERAGQKFNVPLIGKYNLENALGVIAIAESFIPSQKIATALTKFKAPKGRMELVQTEPFTVIIDFAHTPNSLKEALASLNELKTKTQRLIVVFGCAAKRDKERRTMGAVAAELADIVILTAEDPRDEKLADINTEIYEHAKKTGGELVSRIADHKAYVNTKLSVILTLIETSSKNDKKPVIAFDEDSVKSREDAIDLAVKMAQKGDIVFTTGKAHEQSLAFGAEEKEYPWNEHEVVVKSLNSLG